MTSIGLDAVMQQEFCMQGLNICIYRCGIKGLLYPSNSKNSSMFYYSLFDVQVTVHRDKFL